MKRTPLYNEHVRLGARLVEFAGWEMPIQYTSIINEHRAVRSSCGIFDLSHMGEIMVTGSDAEAFLDYMVTGAVFSMKPGKIIYALLCNEKGGTVDDLLVYKKTHDTFLLVVNASTTDKDYEWLITHASSFNISIENMSNSIALIALQGPDAETILKPMVKHDISSIPYYYFIETFFSDIPVLISRTGYTGEDGFEIYCAPEKAALVWNSIMHAQTRISVTPIGLGARDSLRLEAGMPLYGHELNDDISPIEAGIAWAVKFNKNNFIGKDVLMRQMSGVHRNLICFTMNDTSIPRTGYAIYDNQGMCGNVSSGTFSPTLNKGIGMGFMREKDPAGTLRYIEIRQNKHSCTVVNRPFYKRKRLSD